MLQFHCEYTSLFEFFHIDFADFRNLDQMENMLHLCNSLLIIPGFNNWAKVTKQLVHSVD